MATNTARSTSLVLRPYRGSEDDAALVEARNAAMLAAGSLELATPEGFAQMLAHQVNCDLATDFRVAELGGRSIGYVRVNWLDELRGERIHRIVWFFEPSAPETTLVTMLDWAEARHMEVIRATPTERPRSLLLYVPGDTPATTRELTRRGYREVRISFEMRRPTLVDLPDPALPAGIETRPVTPDQLRAIWEAEVEAFQGHWGSTESDAGEVAWDEFRSEPLNDFALWQVAWQGDEVVGMVRPFINPAEIERLGVRRGWCENISVRAPWRGRGVARALIGRALLALRERGMTEAALGVDAQNETGALALYESVGFREASRETEWRRPVESGGDR